jgi:hypothetical protein
VSLLPNLIDRQNQERQLWRVVDPAKAWRAATFVVCGRDEEGFDEFAKRLALHTLRHDELGERLPGAVDAAHFHVEWPDPLAGDELDIRWEDYLTALARSRGLKVQDVVDGATLAGKIYGKSSSWVVFSRMTERAWTGETVEMVAKWADYWAKADKTFTERTVQESGFGRLIAMLCISTAQITPDVPRKEVLPAGVLALPGFEPVKKDDVQTWWLSFGGELEPAQIDDFTVLFPEPGVLPMRQWVTGAKEKLRARKVSK